MQIGKEFRYRNYQFRTKFRPDFGQQNIKSSLRFTLKPMCLSSLTILFSERALMIQYNPLCTESTCFAKRLSIDFGSHFPCSCPPQLQNDWRRRAEVYFRIPG